MTSISSSRAGADQTISVVMPVYQDGQRALATVCELLKQVLPDEMMLEVIVVDDGSEDDIVALFGECRDERLQLLQLPINEGRAAARNTGARAAKGRVIAFMDCDCRPVQTNFLATHLSLRQQGCVASTGRVIGTEAGFWSRYQSSAASRRERQYAQGNAYVGSSTNFVVQRSAFEKVGGFDTQYRHYGFEDRDLLLRLAEIGDVAWAEGASVRHLDELTLAKVSRKLMEAGEHNAALFAKRFPAAYKVLGFSAIDAHLHPWLRPIGKTLGRLALAVAPSVDPWLERVPFPIAKTAVKVTSALAFLYGTTRTTDA